MKGCKLEEGGMKDLYYYGFNIIISRDTLIYIFYLLYFVKTTLLNLNRSFKKIYD